MLVAESIETRVSAGEATMRNDVDFEKRVNQIQAGSKNNWKDSKAELDLDAAALEGDAGKQVELLTQARKRVTQLEHELDRTRKRLEESERSLETRDDEIQKLQEQLSSKPASTGISEEEIVALHQELQTERQNMEEDRLSMEEQFRVLEMQMSRERAEIARERSELARLKQQYQIDPSSGQIQVGDPNRIRRMREEMLGTNESQIPTLDRHAPEEEKKSGLLKRFLGRG